MISKINRVAIVFVYVLYADLFLQSREAAGIMEVEQAHKASLAALEKWRMNEVTAVKQQHQDWRLECGEAKNNLQPVRTELDIISKTVNEFLTANGLDFLKVTLYLMIHIWEMHTLIDVKTK